MKDKKSIYLALTVAICCIIIGVVAIISVSKRYNDKLKDKDSQITAISDTLKVWKDADGLNNAKIQNLVFENYKLFTTLQLGDKELTRLQELVIKYERDLKKGGSALFVQGKTVFDTVYVPLNIPKEYVFTDSISNKWISFRYEKDTTGAKFNLETRTDLDIIVGQESKGFLWKTYTPTLKIVDNNPYSTTTSARSVTFDKSLKQKRFGIGPSAGINFDKNFKVKPVWGFTANYNLIYLF